MTETEESHLLLPVELADVNFVLTVNTGVSNIGVAPVDPALQPGNTHVFNQSMVLVIVKSVLLDDITNGKDQTEVQHMFMMEADHAVDRGMALVKAGLRAQQHKPLTAEEMLALINKDTDQ